MFKCNQLTRDIDGRKNGERKIFKFKSRVCSQCTNQLSETVTMRSYLLALGVTVAKTFLNHIPYGTKYTTVVLYMDTWKLPGEIYSVKIILLKEIESPIDKCGTRVDVLDLSAMSHFIRVIN